MLNKEHWYFNTIKTYIIAISHIFSDIHVNRLDTNGIVVKDIQVPMTYAGKTKLFYKLQRDSEVDKKINTILPRISFLFDSMKRDSTRSTTYSNTLTITSDGMTEDFQYNPIPYDFNFSATIWSKYTDDILQIIEQLCSFFDPDFTVTVHEIPALNITKDISIILNDINVQTENEFDDDDRLLTADLDLTLKGYIYKPITNESVIKHIIVNMKNLETQEILETINHIWNDINQDIDTTIT
jgi:hypothetical protein